MRWIAVGVALMFVMPGMARADDDKAEQAFAAGQFTGAATFCGVPRGEVNALAKAMLDAFGVDSSGPSPLMTKFTEGVAAGAKEQKDDPQATCDEVKQGFGQMKSRMQ